MGVIVVIGGGGNGNGNGQLGKPAPGVVCNQLWDNGVCPGWEEEPQYPVDTNDFPHPPLQNPCPTGFHPVASNSGITGRRRSFVCVQDAPPATVPPGETPVVEEDGDKIWGFDATTVYWIGGGIAAIGGLYFLSTMGEAK